MADFQEHLETFAAIETRIAALSVDNRTDAAKTMHDEGLTFPVACEVDPFEIARETGVYFDPDQRYLHAAGFILDPGGVIKLAVYSTGPIGRLVADDCIKLIKHFRKKSS